MEKTAAAGGKTIEFYPGQALSPANGKSRVDPGASDETIELLKAKAKQHGLVPDVAQCVGYVRGFAQAESAP